MIALTLALLSLGKVSVQAQEIEKPRIKSETTFAIVIDKDTYQYAKAEVQAYKQAVEKDGLGTYIVVEKWTSPEQIKTVLEDLYRQKTGRLEGAVLVGEIPVPMIRDAQFLTSAFKMNQKIRWDKSSVPSDRFYDDFDLRFDFLRQETEAGKENYFYYSLNEQSNQFIEMDIYTARIKPPVVAGEDAKDKIKDYLQKVVRLHGENNPLTDMMVSTGHGYTSNAVNSALGDALALKSQFPTLFMPGNSIKFMNFRNTDFIKFNMLAELKRPGMDFAFMTGHGTAAQQVLNGYPSVSNPQPSMQNVARYLRAKMRAAKEDGRDVEKVKADFQASLGVNDKWFEDAFVASSIVEDSIYNENMDMQFYDVKDAGIQARLVYLNSCLTGSFHLKEYIAGYYPFSKNETIVALANSVGVLQDLWPGELIGILQHGVRVGNWLKHTAYLETHILGDPTFAFSGARAASLNQALAVKTGQAGYWKDLLKTPDADLQALSLIYLSRLLPAKEASNLLRKYYFESAYETVRMEAFQLLRNFEDKNYFDVLHAAKNDSYEYIRRRVAYDLADFGGDDFVKDQLEFYVSDPHSERVAYRTRWNLQFLNPTLARQYVNELIRENKALVQGDSLANKLDRDIEVSQKKTATTLATITDKKKLDKDRIGEINNLRLYRNHALIPALIAMAKDAENSDDVRRTALEVMGWYNISVRRPEIAAACDEIAARPNEVDVIKKEAIKTKKRVTSKQHS